MPDRAVTKQEAARHLGVSVRTIERRIRDGTLRTALVHAHRGSQTRVILDPPATNEVADATPAVAVATSPVAAVSRVEAVARAVPVATNPDTALLLAALAEANRERQALAYRLGQAEAQLARRQRPWWRFWRRG